jgi:broad specificity phosphatase PhoE
VKDSSMSPVKDSSGSRIVLLARHGQTALNVEGRLRGLANPPLDEIGRAEAERLGAELAERDPSVVVSSPLDRAVQTARIVALAAGVPHLIDERFNDRDYGPWTGHLKADVVEKWGSVDDAPGAESVSSVLARSLPALDQILYEHLGHAIVIVTHDAVIRPLVEAIDSSLTDLRVPSGSWNELMRANGRWTVVSIDNITS